MKMSAKQMRKLAALWRGVAELGTASLRQQRLAWAEELERLAASQRTSAPDFQTGIHTITDRVSSLFADTRRLWAATNKLAYRTATNVEISRQCVAELSAAVREARRRRGGTSAGAAAKPQ